MSGHAFCSETFQVMECICIKARGYFVKYPLDRCQYRGIYKVKSANVPTIPAVHTPDVLSSLNKVEFIEPLLTP